VTRIETLAAETGLEPRSVKRAIRELERSGWWHITITALVADTLIAYSATMVSGLAPFSGAIKPAAAQLGEHLDPIAAVEAVNQEIAVAIAESEIVALAQ